jgi:hypothetical protein
MEFFYHALINRARLLPKTCIQILKGLNKHNHTKWLALDHLFSRCIIWLSAEIKKKFFKFVPFGITPLTAFSVLQGVCSSLLRLHTLRLENAAKSAIADFSYSFGC